MISFRALKFTLLLPLASAFPSPQKRDQVPHDQPHDWHCSIDAIGLSSCVTSSEYTTPAYINSTSPTIPGYTSCVDACWYDAYHVKACHRVTYVGEKSTSIAMVSGHYRVAGDDRYYNVDTREQGLWRGAEKDGEGMWKYTKVSYDGEGSQPRLKFEEFTATESRLELGCEWLDWECPFEKRSPITGIEPFGTLAGSDVGLLETSGSLMVNPYGPYGEFWKGG